MDPTELQQYMTLMQQYSSDPSSLPAVQYQTESPQAGVQAFQNTPAYQLAYGTNATSSNPAVNFANDPGVQLSIQQGMQPLMNNYAARGLGQSGAAASALGQYMYNNYNSYTGGQNTMFNNYQTQLGQLASLGSSTASNLGSQAATAGSTIGTGTSANDINTVSQAATATQNTGSNIAGLLGNQGVLDASAYLNTGAAQANNLFNGASLQSQINSSNQASNNATQNSMLNAQGSQNQVNTLKGSIF